MDHHEFRHLSEPAKLDEIYRVLRDLTKGETIIMGQLEDLTAAIDAETNAVAAKLDHLSAELAAAVAAGQAPKPETLAALSAISDRLKSLGSNPAAPIPAPVTPAPAPTEPVIPVVVVDPTPAPTT